MIVIIGASASGKTEISKILQKKYNYHKLITTTTRPMRDNEVNHLDYHFISETEFLTSLKNDEFLEHNYYNNNYYGINKKDVRPDALVIVDPNGANFLIDKLKEHAFVVFVETNIALRKKRMLQRGDKRSLVVERIKNDVETFDPKRVRKIDLKLINNKILINDLAEEIHQAYLKYNSTKK